MPLNGLFEILIGLLSGLSLLNQCEFRTCVKLSLGHA